MCMCVHADTHTQIFKPHIHRPEWLTLAEGRKEKARKGLEVGALSNFVQPLDDKPSEDSLGFHSGLAVHQPPALVFHLGNSGHTSCISELQFGGHIYLSSSLSYSVSASSSCFLPLLLRT